MLAAEDLQNSEEWTESGEATRLHPSEHCSGPLVRFPLPLPPCALGEPLDVGHPSRSWFSVDFPPQPGRLFCQRPAGRKVLGRFSERGSF